MQVGVYIHGSSPFSPRESIEDYIELVQHYDYADVHSLWFADHLIRTPDPDKNPLFETWSLMAGLAHETTSLTFGTLVSPITFRKFGPFIKQVVTTDHLLKGRLILGLGAGWFYKEYSMFGVDFPSTKDRLQQLEEWLQALDLLFTEDNPVDFSGDFLSLDQAYLKPGPKNGYIPILIGGAGEQVTLNLVAKYGDFSNFGGNYETLQHKLSVLWKHCDTVGRPRSEISPSTNQAIITGKTNQEVESGIDQYLKRFREIGREPPSREKLGDNRLIGTIDEIVQQLGVLEDLGIDLTILTVNETKSSELIPELIDEL